MFKNKKHKRKVFFLKGIEIRKVILIKRSCVVEKKFPLKGTVKIAVVIQSYKYLKICRSILL